MKAVAATAPGVVEVVDIPMPEPREYECLVRVTASGLCNSTDLKIIHNELSGMTTDFPVILGHEGVGEVVEAGSKVENIKIGDCFTNPIGRLAPGTPFNSMWANMKEYAIVQDHAAMDELGCPRSEYSGGATRCVPSDMLPQDAAMLLTLKECFSALRNFGLQPGMEVLVYGDGPVGLGLCQFLRLGGAGWVGVIGHRKHRLERITGRCPLDLAVNSHEQEVAEAVAGRRFDLVIDAVGSVPILKDAARMLKPGGKVGVYGVLKKKYADINLLDLPNNICVHMLNFPHGEHAAHEEVLQMVLDGKVNPADYYTHLLPIDEAARGVELIVSREAFKVIYTMD